MFSSSRFESCFGIFKTRGQKLKMFPFEKLEKKFEIVQKLTRQLSNTG